MELKEEIILDLNSDIIEYSLSENDDFNDFVKKIDNKLDYFVIKTSENIDLIEKLDEKDSFFSNFLIEKKEKENKYLCSYKYYLLNNKLYKYDSFIINSDSKKTFILENAKYIIKYTLKYKDGEINSFFNETKIEKKILEKLENNNYDFVEKQKLISSEETENYILIVKSKINGKTLKKNDIRNLKKEDKLKIITELAKQLSILESYGYVYTDLRIENFMVDDDCNAYLIDLGSVSYNDKNKKYYNITRCNTFNVIDNFLLLIYNFFNLRNNFISVTKYNTNTKNKLYCINNYELFSRGLVITLMNNKLIYSDIYNILSNLNIKNYKMHSKNNNILNVQNFKKLIKNKEYFIDKKEEYIDKIKILFKEEINSVLEIQCGNYSQMKNFNIKDNYIGVNIDNDIIEENKQRFRYDKNKLFIQLDPINEPLPKTDLLFCNNILQYLPIDYIWLLLENFRDSEAKYLAINYCYNKIKTLSEEPFYLPLPVCIVPTENRKLDIAIYDINKIKFFMSKCFDTKLRKELVFHFDNVLNKVYETFMKYDNGKNLLFEAFKDEEVDYDKYYYNDNYKKIVDDGIFDEYIDLLIVKNSKAQEVERLQKEAPYGNLITEENIKEVKNILIDYFNFKYNLI